MNQIEPFALTVLQSDLDDLQQRLAHTRFAPAVPGDSWDYGTPEAYLRSMVERWQAFDWRAVEDRVNAYPGFLTEVDGQRIHFLHVRSAVEDATPLLLAHSYPGSILDFLDMIDPLVDPEAHGGTAADAFHVVIPSMPGFGWSTPVVDTGWTMARVAGTYDQLMRRLGYPSYGVHGSDGGAMVGRELAVLDPEGFRGAHVLQLFSFPSGDPSEFEAFGPKEYAALEHLGWFQSVGGYNQMNGTRPQTVAAGLADSPVAVLAYSELFESFGNGTSLVTPEQVLAQATLYWLTNTYGSAARYHFEEQRSGAEPVVSRGRIGVAVFKDDFQTIRPLAERDNAGIQHWTEHERGGHYAAMEVPDEVVADLRVFFA
ncbi:epoxide hydrolase family protein [Nocardioides sp. MH1]|uniref:epoxide hydrolase family protein n=1 Tax=Nocardioides sp. MH1 TaxID=3242490 RepID=UPI003520C297